MALQFGEVVWQRGLLSKGLGLCHGISGNGLALLSLADAEPKWWRRAVHFAIFGLEHQEECL